MSYSLPTLLPTPESWRLDRHPAPVRTQEIGIFYHYWHPHPETKRADLFGGDITSSRSPAGPPSVVPHCHHRKEL